MKGRASVRGVVAGRILELPFAEMAASQLIRSGTGPEPTCDPDLRSRPPFQTLPRNMFQTFRSRPCLCICLV